MRNFPCLPPAEEQDILPTETLFEYTGTERYIEMQERFRTSVSEEILLSHIICDQELSIVHRKYKELIEVEAHPQSQDAQEEGEVVYLFRKQEQPILYRKYYQKYLQLSDFIFGREQWGRTENCLRISSDLISRLHSRIAFNNAALRKTSETLLAIIKNIIKHETHYSSPFRKVSYQLWERIIEYAEDKPKYTVKDCGSRNGTYLMDRSLHAAELRQGEGYEFQTREYILHVNQILHERGSNVSRRLLSFHQNWKEQQFYNHQYTLKVICGQNLLEALPNMTAAVHAIHFQIEFSHELKYFFWIIQDSSEAKYFSIGECQTINIASSSDRFGYDSGRHGALVLSRDKWTLHPVYSSENLWVKLPSELQYQLCPSREYRIRLGHLNIVDLSFHNYS